MPKLEIDPATAILVAMMQSLLAEAIRRSGRSRTAVARDAGTQLGVIARHLRKENLTLRSVARILAACGFELRCELVPAKKPGA